MSTISETSKEVFAKAADLLETKGWTQAVLARDADNREISLLSEKATCFCTLGAVYRVMGLSGYQGVAPEPIYELARALDPNCALDEGPEGVVWEWSDDHNEPGPIIAKLRELSQ